MLAPTGTIGFMMDCDTTGIEPDFSLVKFKKLVGGGSMQIVNQTIPRALKQARLRRRDGRGDHRVHRRDTATSSTRPGLKLEHYEVFDTAMGQRAIKPMGHVRMMAAAQPFLSGAISKTVNLPETATVEEIAEVYLQGWKLGLKALAVYRDNCKVGQPLSDGKPSRTDDKKTAAVETESRGEGGLSADPQAAAQVATEPYHVVLGRRGRGLHDLWFLPGRRPRRGVPQARQAGLDSRRRDGRLLHCGVDRACSTACRWRPSCRSSPTSSSSRLA